MGTITARKRQDGSMAFRALIHLKQNGRTVHKESKTFDRRPTAKAWMARREKELREPGGLEAAQGKKGTLDDLIGTYLQKMQKSIGRTKAQCLNTLRKTELARMNCEDIRSPHIVEFAAKLGEELEPSTVANYMSHLSAVIRLGRPAWGYPIDHRVMSDARTVTDDLGVTGNSKVRDRRPTREELDLLMAYFIERSARGRASPMEIIVPFAIFSTRRQGEISEIIWADYEEHDARYMVRDMKHPGQKVGNDVWCDAPPEVIRILGAMPRHHKRIFPYGADGVSKAFTDACKIMNIDDLHFHDLRHEGVSRLFEMGMNIPFVAMVSGHRSWQSLKRYTNLSKRGDKYEGWKWWPAVEEAARNLPKPV